MALWKTPKTDWQPADVLTDQDMSRIEGNTEYLKDVVDKTSASLGARYYFTDTDSGISSYKLMLLNNAPATEYTLSFSSLTDGQYLAGWIMQDSDIFEKLLAGVYSIELYAQRTSGTQTVRLYFELVERKSDNSEVVVATSDYSNELGDSKQRIVIPLTLFEDYIPSSGSYIVVKLYASVSGGGSAPSIDIFYGGTSKSYWSVPVNTEILRNQFAEKDLNNVENIIFLNKIKNVDGSGSGLDADLLDGQHADYFEKKARNITSQSLYGISTYNIPDGTEILEVYNWNVQTLTLPSAANYVGKFLYVIMTQPADVDGASITFETQSGETIAGYSSITFNLDALSGYPPTWYNPTQDQHGFVFTAIDSTHWVVVSRY